MINWGTVPLGEVLPFHFGSYDGATGASEALSGLAVTDIEIYKDGTVTQRSSDAGYVLLDTDGIDIDGMVGANGFTIDTGDNTDAGFFVAGSSYLVWVSSVTIDGQTVNVLVGSFRLCAAENTAGVPVVDTVRVSNTVQTARDLGGQLDAAVSTRSSQASVDTIDDFLDMEIAQILTDIAALQADVDTLLARLTAGRATNLDNLDAAVSGRAAPGDLMGLANGAITAAKWAAGGLDAAAVAADVGEELADALLARNINGGSSAGRTVKQALKRLRNRVAIAAGTMTVYDEDDTSSNWTAAVTTAAGDPVSEVNPA